MAVFLSFPFSSKPSAQRPARMEELVQLQTPAVVLRVGLGVLVVKVCGMYCMQNV